MSDKKTSEESTGTNIGLGDYFRIARSGNNYKLSSTEIFSQTISLSDFYTLAADQELIPGRTYTVTGCGSPSVFTLRVTAQTNNTFGCIAHIVTGSQYNEGSIVIHDGTLVNFRSIIDTYGNYYSQAAYPVNPIEGTNNIFQGLTNIQGGNYNINNSHIVNSGLFNTAGGHIELASCNINSAAIVNTDGATLTMDNCNISNCTIVAQSGCVLNGLTIIGSNNPTYVFENVQASNGTIITGLFNTIRYSIDLSSNLQSKTISLGRNLDWVGIFELVNGSVGDTIAYIVDQGMQSHTPIRFENQSNVPLFIEHSNTVFGASGGEIVFADHHLNNADLTINGTYFEANRSAIQDAYLVSKFINYQ